MPLLTVEAEETNAGGSEVDPFGDERLIFTCCYPALSLEARVAPTLRLVCGLRTDEIARLLLVSESTMAARITRAKKKISSAGIPYRVPDGDEQPERLLSVLAVIFLVFTEGHTATGGTSLQRPDLIRLAHQLAAVLRELIPDNAGVLGLSALMRLTDARGTTRLDADGGLVLLEHQDRSRWDRAAIVDGVTLVERALRVAASHQPGPYAVQAAITAVHEAPSFDQTDWLEIVALYNILLEIYPSPVAAIGRAVAVGMAFGPQAGLEELDRIGDDPSLARYPMAQAARADMLRRSGRYGDAVVCYIEATRTADNAVVQAFLARRIGEMRTVLPVAGDGKVRRSG
jgi:RNA polymerase sigma-70 factor (ECF subfamily)